ncbi:MAG: hypothetical protein IPN15_15760 [Saprospiraceae bacterium]|nr:hypothetical protein [Candidatus Vicinibacter affinis]
MTVGYKYEEAMGMEEEWKASQNGKDHYKIHAQIGPMIVLINFKVNNGNK